MADSVIERSGRTAIVHLAGDVAVSNAQSLYALLAALGANRELDKIVLDFADVERVDSSAVAIVALARNRLAGASKQLELEHLADRERALFAVLPSLPPSPPPPPRPGWLEELGDAALAAAKSARDFAKLVFDTARTGAAVVLRRERLPAGAVAEQVLKMGANAVFIVGLLSFLLGMSIAFQGAVQLRRFGATVYVSDLVGLSMVREFAPMMTAVMITGRTGAAIAAELGTMRVGLEIDALVAMGVSPIRFLVMPRLIALTIVQPILTLMGMFIGICGGITVGAVVLQISPESFWFHLIDRLTFSDFLQGLAKSVAFAWIIGLSGVHLGLRATGDASSVGTATTRSVVASVFCIILFDAGFETMSTLLGWS